MRRSRLDIRLGQRLHVGMELRRRKDSTVWQIQQLHRYDCQADLRMDGQRITVPFSDLREGWDIVAPVQEAA